MTTLAIICAVSIALNILFWWQLSMARAAMRRTLNRVRGMR